MQLQTSSTTSNYIVSQFYS